MKNNKTYDIGKQLNDILGEVRTLTGVIGILFGFLLATAFSAQNLNELENKLLIGALYCSIISLGIFIMPIIYHHLEFPYKNIEKFIKRFHRFTMLGFVPFVLTFFFAIYLAFERLAPGNGHIGILAIVITLILVYYLRK
ncbi:MAG: DUF6328 family protein [Candidatus Micrarchaeia archaeon]|jgi:membrane-associated HD superfamily phosphohydrolase